MLMLMINIQLFWMQADYDAHDNGLKHTFVFTHGPIVGHGGGTTHDSYALIAGSIVKIEDRDIPFVEWVNEAGMTVEAVFMGHMHSSGGFKNINTQNIDYPNPSNSPHYYNWNGLGNSLFSENTVYIETDTGTCNYP